ncbi:DNA ligase [Turkeypox virus]|uniref:DNA ligase n=1 Tax=Turkeypox virus TaxID=336486 RepID=A0A0M3PB49_9POXV|nr:DNA ligase [Turkeypox virus]ALA62396.2 DNA ligase [Turkeypox virus]
MGNSFKEFRQLCLFIYRESRYIEKTRIIHDYIHTRFKGNIHILIKLLLPGIDSLKYNISDKQIVKLFSKILCIDVNEINSYVTGIGDVAYVIGSFLKISDIKYLSESILTIDEVYEFLLRLSRLTKERDKIKEFSNLLPKCTPNDIRYIIRLVKHDIRINAGPKHILSALHHDAYKFFKLSNDLEYVINKCLDNNIEPSIRLMTPIKPMLANICKTFSEARQKCLGKMLIEFKYDGERIQIHKDRNSFKYFSRSLKPVIPHKIEELEESLMQAFPNTKNIILDAELILLDKDTKQPLPFGTLGINKKTMYDNACTCLFIFDCMYFNDSSIINIPLNERREIISKNIIEISNRILLSETKVINTDKELCNLLHKVLSKGIEGFVIKDASGIYEPGVRRWMKVKKDYLDNGSMADKADLVVLGAYYGKGYKSGILSSFLMGCYDDNNKKWCSVTKCSGGHSDKELIRIQKSIRIVEFDKEQIPDWLCINKKHYPDVIISDIRYAPVWEIIGSEFTKSNTHTASNISIRFPRCTRIRDDKDYLTATTLKELELLYDKSFS